MLLVAPASRWWWVAAVSVALLLPLPGCAPITHAGRASLARALTFHASFDRGVNADFSKGDGRVYTASSMRERGAGRPGLSGEEIVSLAPGEGRFGGALRFHRKVPKVVFFKGARNVDYRTRDWSGTVSLWLKLDPDEDLEPGYCDPIQITPRQWNDAAFFVDFSRDERPRHFRLGAFADRAVWDPEQRELDSIPDNERPLVTHTHPPFSRDRWTHVAFTWERFNTSRADGVARLYLNGQLHGALTNRTQTFTWDPQATLILFGLNYIGLYDELAIFNRALTADEVRQLYARENGLGK